MTSRSILMAAAGSSTTAYVDDVFSTYLYTGNGISQNINNGIVLGSTAAWNTTSVSQTFNSSGKCLAVDSSGNFYLTGYVISGTSYAVIAKYNSSGVIQWQRYLTETTNNTGLGFGIAVDSSGNVYVTGNFGSGPSYIITAKYNSSGTLQWQNKVFQGNNSAGYSVAVDSSGNVYVTGYANNTTVDYLITYKLNSSGTLQWQRSLTESTYAYGSGIAVDTSGNAYVTGYLHNGTNVYAAAAKYNTSGTLQWQRKLLDLSTDTYGIGVAVDASGNMYVVSYVLGATPDCFVAKYNTSGALQWQRKIVVNSATYYRDVAVDSTGNIYIAGRTGASSFVIKYNSSGTLQWQRMLVSSSANNSVAVDSSGFVYIAGQAAADRYVSRLLQDGTTVSGTAYIGLSQGSNTDTAGTATDSAGTATAATSGASNPAPTATDSAGATTATFYTQAAVTGVGGMVLFKGRSGATDWAAYDTVRGVTKDLVTNSTAAQTTQTTGLSSFNINGFSTVLLAKLNTNSAIYSSWTFAKSPKFFDVVSWTGDNTTRNISHSLGITPGMIVVKRTDSASTQGWVVWHTSTGGTNNLLLNTSAVPAPLVNGRISAATANTFTVQSGSTNIADVNATGGTYVAYLFANNTATDGLIQCGGFTADGSGNATVTLGWEPQWVLLKRTDVANDWQTLDVFRGFTVNATNELLLPNTAGAATNGGPFYTPTSTGFKAVSRGASSTHIYVAIRRPNKPPTVGTQVFQPTVYTGTNVNNRLVNTTIAPDLAIARQRNDAVLAGSVVGDRLRGQPYLLTGSTAIEVTSATALDQQLVGATEYGTAFSSMSGFYVGTDATAKLNVNTTASNHVAWAFKRAPGFFDMVCYTGTGAAKTESHNLGVVPELMIVKQRSSTVDAWIVYNSSSGNTKHLVLNTTAIPATNVNVWNSTTPTASVFTVGTDGQVNENTQTYVAYLFATLAGISKVGTYTGNGSSQTVNCGFTTGARFVLIKRTDATGDWYVWDSARGIVAGNDPYLAWNSTAAEVTTNDTVDADNSGFIVNQLAATNANVTSATYIFLAIA